MSCSPKPVDQIITSYEGSTGLSVGGRDLGAALAGDFAFILYISNAPQVGSMTGNVIEGGDSSDIDPHTGWNLVESKIVEEGVPVFIYKFYFRILDDDYIRYTRNNSDSNNFYKYFETGSGDWVTEFHLSVRRRTSEVRELEFFTWYPIEVINSPGSVVPYYPFRPLAAAFPGESVMRYTTTGRDSDLVMPTATYVPSFGMMVGEDRPLLAAGQQPDMVTAGNFNSLIVLRYDLRTIMEGDCSSGPIPDPDPFPDPLPIGTGGRISKIVLRNSIYRNCQIKVAGLSPPTSIQANDDAFVVSYGQGSPGSRFPIQARSLLANDSGNNIRVSSIGYFPLTEADLNSGALPAFGNTRLGFWIITMNDGSFLYISKEPRTSYAIGSKPLTKRDTLVSLGYTAGDNVVIDGENLGYIDQWTTVGNVLDRFIYNTHFQQGATLKLVDDQGNPVLDDVTTGTLTYTFPFDGMQSLDKFPTYLFGEAYSAYPDFPVLTDAFLYEITDGRSISSASVIMTINHRSFVSPDFLEITTSYRGSDINASDLLQNDGGPNLTISSVGKYPLTETDLANGLPGVGNTFYGNWIFRMNNGNLLYFSKFGRKDSTYKGTVQATRGTLLRNLGYAIGEGISIAGETFGTVDASTTADTLLDRFRNGSLAQSGWNMMMRDANDFGLFDSTSRGFFVIYGSGSFEVTAANFPPRLFGTPAVTQTPVAVDRTDYFDYTVTNGTTTDSSQVTLEVLIPLRAVDDDIKAVFNGFDKNATFDPFTLLNNDEGNRTDLRVTSVGNHVVTQDEYNAGSAAPNTDGGNYIVMTNNGFLVWYLKNITTPPVQGSNVLYTDTFPYVVSDQRTTATATVNLSVVQNL